VRDLPRQLTHEQLSELFEGDTALVRKLAGTDHPLENARDAITSLTEAEKLEALNAHPAIGQRAGLSARSATEQGADADPAVLEELARLNAEYEQRHGFRFVVFVNRRPKAEILEVLRSRIDNPREQELDTAVGELCAIAEDRWRRIETESEPDPTAKGSGTDAL
jgi:2-oxo-4-hydroxy-4-carboxy--5-ureidoimidazoline (OHCU) decarboxylase